MPEKKYPVRNQQYTYGQIQELTLDDAPHLGFMYRRTSCVIQDSHCTVQDLLSVPGFAQLLWRYEYTTEEWIPVFKAVDSDAVLACVDMEHEVNDPNCWWVTPKGFPREQYKYGMSFEDSDDVPTLSELDKMQREED